MKHTFASVLPLFVAALGEPSHEFDADDVRDYGFHSVTWCLAEHGNYHTITLTDEDGVLGVVATGARDATRGGGLCAGWVLNADDAAPNDNLDGDPVATPEEALRLAREWAKVPT
jgi:hypothetical protein